MSANGLEIDCGAFIACGQINLSRQSIWINNTTEKGNFYSRKKTNKLDLSSIYSRKSTIYTYSAFIAGNTHKLDLSNIYSRKNKQIRSFEHSKEEKTNKLYLSNIFSREEPKNENF